MHFVVLKTMPARWVPHCQLLTVKPNQILDCIPFKPFLHWLWRCDYRLTTKTRALYPAVLMEYPPAKRPVFDWMDTNMYSMVDPAHKHCRRARYLHLLLCMTLIMSVCIDHTFWGPCMEWRCWIADCSFQWSSRLLIGPATSLPFRKRRHLCKYSNPID
jgi:hypothetical protein